MDAAHKARIAQAQHRHQTHRCRASSSISSSTNASPSPSIKLRRSSRCHLRRARPPAIEHPVIPVIARHPAALKRTETPDPMAAGSVSRKVRIICKWCSRPGCRPGKPEIIANKVIKIELRRQKQGQRIKQTGLPHAFSPIRTLFCSSINDKRLIPRKPTISTRSRSISLRYTTTLLQ